MDAAAASPTPGVAATATEEALECPVPADICRLATEFESAIRTGDGEAIAKRAVAQQLSCPTATTPAPEDVVLGAVAAACRGDAPGATIQAYEFHNGKAPFYYRDSVEFAKELTDVLQGFGQTEALRVVAVGCGAEEPASQPACGRAAVVVYGAGEADSPVFVALVFSRASEAAEWTVEKVWAPFPSAIPLPAPRGLRLEMNTSAGPGL